MRFRALFSVPLLLLLGCHDQPTSPDTSSPGSSAAGPALSVAPGVTVEYLGALAEGDWSEAFGINNRGDVVGVSYAPDGIGDRYDRARGFLWSDGVMEELGDLGGGATIPWRINNRGQVAGDSKTADGEWHSFLWTRGTGMVDLRTLGGPRSSTWDLNERGEVVGQSRLSNMEPDWHAFIWTEKEGMVDLGAPAGDVISGVFGINASGVMVGYARTGLPRSNHRDRPLMWTRKRELVELTPRLDAHHAPIAINDPGTVAGYTWDVNWIVDGQAFLWSDAGGYVDLPTPADFTGARVWDFNNLGEAVGLTHRYEEGVPIAQRPTRAVFWTRALEPLELPPLPGMFKSRADGMNERGQVVGWSFETGGPIRAVRWTVK